MASPSESADDRLLSLLRSAHEQLCRAEVLVGDVSDGRDEQVIRGWISEAIGRIERAGVMALPGSWSANREPPLPPDPDVG